MEIMGIALSASEVIVTGGGSLVDGGYGCEENMSEQRIRAHKIEVLDR